GTGRGNLYAAQWKKEIDNYVILKDADTLPSGQGFWLASDSGVANLVMPASRSLSSDTGGFFEIKLTTGWNLVTCPSFKPIPWPAQRGDGDAYFRSPLKGLRALGETGYVLS